MKRSLIGDVKRINLRELEYMRINFETLKFLPQKISAITCVLFISILVPVGVCLRKHVGAAM